MLDSTANLYSLCHHPLTNQSATIAYVMGHTYAVLTNQSIAMAYVTGCTSRGIRTPTINQSERDYSVRHGVHVTACVRNALCTPFCTSLHTPLHIPAHPSAHPFVHTPLHTPLHIPLCTPLRTSLHTPKNPARSVPILLLALTSFPRYSHICLWRRIVFRVLFSQQKRTGGLAALSVLSLDTFVGDDFFPQCAAQYHWRKVRHESLF